MSALLFAGDHALLDLNRFQGIIPRQVTVRTKSRDSLSSDSVPIPIPAQVLRLKRHNIPQNNLPPRRGGARYPSMMEGEESFSDREVAGFHMPTIGGTIGGLNITNRLKTHFNLMRTNDIPDNTKDTDRHGRPLNPREIGGRGGPVPPDPRGGRPPVGVGVGVGGGPLSSRGGYPPQHPQQPLQPHQRSKQAPPDQYYGGGGVGGRPPRPGPRPTTDVRHRLFVALFDYDPPTMSPNPDACEEELPFREGQLIKVLNLNFRKTMV